MTKSKMEQYAKGWKHPDQRAAEKRETPPAPPKSKGKPAKGC